MLRKNIIHLIYMFIIRNVYKALINIVTQEVLDGEIPSRQLKLVIAWIEIHKDELLADWLLCQNGEKPFTIEPLK